MTWSLRARVGVALLGALGVIVALQLAAEAFDERQQPKPRARPVPAAESAGAPSPAAARRAVVGLRATQGVVALCHRLRSLAPDVAPVVEVLAGGEVVLRRPEPLPSRPAADAPLSREGYGAAVVLPVADLRELDPGARSALVDLLARWIRDRPVAPDRLRPIDVAAPDAALRRLLSWVP